ncbi:gst-1 [Pristionchus pacificus]|uniref:Glutathione S-transferase n=1 Tax=Pristionchus pacificus TaxID=54126 RepID=A0A2A6CW01_PRIPA|nr:gst-1 [Pristionchus pacificus]|eukprot:PDM82365.1 gst-1 [Pristionchus pacificus]
MPTTLVGGHRVIPPSKMSALKLYYFAIRGLAEPIRMMLIDNGVQFDNITFQKDEKWFAEVKKQFAFGQVPCLKDGDMEIPQSGAIIRHLARKLNLAGETEAEKVFADFFSEGLRDVHEKYCQMIYRDYGSKDSFLATIYPAEWAKVESLLKKHANGEKFVLGDKISYADYLLFEELDIALVLSPTSLDAFPVLKAYHGRFAKREKLQAHLASRNYPVNNNGKQ